MSAYHRANNGPIMAMAVVTVFAAASLLYGIKSLLRFSQNDFVLQLAIYGGLHCLLLLGETILYGVVRKRTYPRGLAWASICFLVAGLMVPGITMSIYMLRARGGEASSVAEMARIVSQVCFGIGHLFFLIVIIKAFSSTNADLKEDEDDAYFSR